MMKNMRVFIIEDEKILRVSLTDDLEDAGYAVSAFEDPLKALEAFKEQPAGIVITDIKMKQMNGIELLSRIKSINPETTVIVITAYGSVTSAVEAMKNGAYDYITKPFQIDEVLILLDRINELQSIKMENRQLRSQFESQYSMDAFVGNGQHVQRIHQLVNTISNTQTTVLITGETGTGKELLANIIHYNSDRRNKPLVKVSCAVLSREIFESELFGHEKGAFTSAMKERLGRFEMSEGGTIYLDDVDDIPLDLQVKLLRVQQEHEFERVGSNKTIKIDVRTIASTKSDLKKLSREGKFREDLYYRLNVFPIHLVPLRERKNDIPLLVNHFIAKMAPEMKINLRPEVMQCLTGYHWPGNVRELKNVVERLLLISSGPDIDVSEIPAEILRPDAVTPEVSVGQKPLDEMMDDIEKNVLRQTLLKTHGHQKQAAELLGIPPSTLRTKMNKYDLKSRE
jgi:DNA-binding NtrC family response regulator